MPRKDPSTSTFFLDQGKYRTSDFPASGYALNVVPYIAAKKAQFPSLTGELLQALASSEFQAHVDGSSRLDASFLLENDVEKRRTGWVPAKERRGPRSSPRLAAARGRQGAGGQGDSPSGAHGALGGFVGGSSWRSSSCSGCLHLRELLEATQRRLEAAISSKGSSIPPPRVRLGEAFQTPQDGGGGRGRLKRNRISDSA